MPVQPERESINDVGVTPEDRPRSLTLARARALRERPSAFTGSRIRLGACELEVVEIGPYRNQDGSMVTFLARPISNASLLSGEVIEPPWGTCKVVT